MSLCKVCRSEPAAVPDRESTSARKTVCRRCHGKRLLADLRHIMVVHKQQEETPK